MSRITCAAVSGIAVAVVFQGCLQSATNKATYDSIQNVEDHREQFYDLLEDTKLAREEKIKLLKQKHGDQFTYSKANVEDVKHTSEDCVKIWNSYRSKALAIVHEEGKLRGTNGDSLFLKRIQNHLKAVFKECKDTARACSGVDDAFRQRCLSAARRRLAREKPATSYRLQIGTRTRSGQWLSSHNRKS